MPSCARLLHFHAKGRIRKLHLALLFIYFVLYFVFCATFQ